MKKSTLVCVVLVGFMGCRSSSNKEEVVGAVDVLKGGLEAWKTGDTPASLLSAENPLQFSDADWEAGAKLLDYRIVKVEGEEDGETIIAVHINVELQGRVVGRQLSYRVMVKPKRAVARYA